MSMVMAAGDGSGGQSIFSGIVSTIRVDNAATFLDRYQQYAPVQQALSAKAQCCSP